MSTQNILKNVRVGRAAESETASRFMRTSCQDIIKLQQDDDAVDGGEKNRKENEIERGRRGRGCGRHKRGRN